MFFLDSHAQAERSPTFKGIFWPALGAVAKMSTMLKRDSVTIFLTLSFFLHQTIPRRTLIPGLKPFRLWLRREDRYENRQNLILRCQWHRGIRIFPLLIFTFSSKYMYVMFPYVFLSLIPRCQWHRWIYFRCLIETTGSFSKNYNLQKVRSRGVIDTAESKLFKRLSRFSQQIRRHMRNGFSPWIRALGGIVWWKKSEGENLVTLSFLEQLHLTAPPLSKIVRRRVPTPVFYRSTQALFYNFSWKKSRTVAHSAGRHFEKVQ
jgi:hypothetical protein